MATEMTIHAMARRALEYIRNAGGSPKVEWFDDDHEPIGPSLRDELIAAGMAEIVSDGLDGDVIVLTVIGEAEVQKP